MPELDLEERLRATVGRQSQAYSPSPDLPALIHARVRDRRRHRATVLGAVAAGVLAVGGLGAALAVGAADPGTEIGPADSTTTTTTNAPETTSTTPAPTTTPSTTAESPTTSASTTTSTTADTSTTSTTRERGPIEPSGVPVTDDTPLDRAGIGPIEGGMTLDEVADAGIPFTVAEPIGPGSTCNVATLDGTGLSLLLSTSGEAGADPFDAVVQSVQGATSTVEGVAVGMTRTEARATYGEPTEVQDYPYLIDGTVEVYAQGGVAYSATLDGSGTITELESGLVGGVGNLEGCA
jgi:hypothetical protein